MIKDRPFNLSPSFGYAPQTNGAGNGNGPSFVAGSTPSGSGNSSYGPSDATAFSGEVSEPDGGDAGISPLLQGLQSWGAPDGGNSAGTPAVGGVDQARQAQGGAPAGQQQPPSQVPVSILQQVLNTEKTAGGMASAGALVSLLKWGESELQNSGQIRPEFQDILHEAIDFGKENKLMSQEQLAAYESRLFEQNTNGEGGRDAGSLNGKQGGDGKACPCHKSKSVKDSLQAA